MDWEIDKQKENGGKISCSVYLLNESLSHHINCAFCPYYLYFEENNSIHMKKSRSILSSKNTSKNFPKTQ